METLSVGVYVTQTTGKAGWTGTIAALGYMPAVILGPLAGALADRFERRPYLLAATTVQGVLAALLAGLAFTDHLSLFAVGLLVGLTGCANTLLGPAFNALLADLVPPADLLSAVSLSSAQYNLARILGPALAAPAILMGGMAFAFGLNTLSFLAVLAAVAFVQVPPLSQASRSAPLFGGILAGVRFAASDSGIRLLLSLTFVTSVLISPFVGLVPAFAIKTFARGAAGTSLLVTCQGLGAVLAALASSGLADTFGRKRLVEGATWVVGPVAALYWLSPTFPIAAGGMFALGAVYLAVITSSNSICLSRTPRGMQARVSSLFSLVLGGGYALGLVVLGWLADRFGLHVVGASAAGVYIALVGGARLWRPGLFAAIDAAPRAEVTGALPLPTPE